MLKLVASNRVQHDIAFRAAPNARRLSFYKSFRGAPLPKAETGIFLLSGQIISPVKLFFSKQINVASNEYRRNDNRGNKLDVKFYDLVVGEFYPLACVHFCNEFVPAPAVLP